MAKKTIWLILAIAAFLLVLKSIVYQGAFEGQVLDALTQQPIANLDIEYTYTVHKLSFGPDTPEPYRINELKIYTDSGGNYRIPGFFSFWNPFDFAPRQITIWFQSDEQSPLSEKYWWERVDTAGFGGGYPLQIKKTHSAQIVAVLLIPKLQDSVEQCELIAEPFSKGKCIEVNSWSLALEKNNASFCENLGDVQQYDVYVKGFGGGKEDCVRAVSS